MAHNNMAPDLVKERNSATFDVDTLSAILAGSREKLERRKYIESSVFDDKRFNGPKINFLERTDMYSEGIRKVIAMVEKMKEMELHDPEEIDILKRAFFPNESNPALLHGNMFLQSLIAQGNDDQRKKWLDKAKNYKILGTYAQTELGHGTFLRGLETTATYDAQNEEFIMNNPTLTSIKWWPGGLGKTSNCAVVMADLLIKGKSHGMHAFFVELRDTETHKPKPGITLGDIGPKFGFNMNDNGFLKLDNVRIPRTNMLMRNAQVLKDGTYVKAKHAKLGYGIMIYSRSKIVLQAAIGLAEAAVIATRYSCVRHQSELKPGAPEPQIIEYQTQQHKVFPEIAAAYAFRFVGQYMADYYKMANSQVQEGKLDNLAELHALSSCLKALASYKAHTGIEALRLACGGHGYSQASGFPKIYIHVTATCTYEGENTVLLLQTARYLVKMQASIKSGGKMNNFVHYLSEKNRPCTLDGSLKLTSLVDTFKHRARRLIQEASYHLGKLSASGMPYHAAWNAASVHLTKAAQAHGQCFVVKNFVDVVRKIDDQKITKVLSDLCRLYAVHLLLEVSGDFMEDGYMTAAQMAMVREAEMELLTRVRPNAVALTDAFCYHDRYLQSELGRYDGNVYENLYKWTCDSPLNKEQVHPSFNKYMRPFQQASKL